MLLAPTLIVLALVAGWPLARTIWFSLTDAHLADLGAARFIGPENYLARDEDGWFGVLADPLWWRAVRNTSVFVIVSVTLETLLGLVIALVLQARFPGRALVRAAVLIPWAIPTIVSAQMWGWMLHDQFGLINDLLMRLGLIGHPLAWTADPGLAMGAVIVADVWKTTPFMALLSLAALQLVPVECLDAARVDGAGAVRTFRHVTLPLILPALTVAVIFRSLDALRIFDLIYVLTPGSEQTMSMSVYARQQLVDFQDVGYGSAASSLLFFFIAACTIGFMVLSRLRPTAGAAR
ncbi:MAG: sugar ABC transporter permease [Pseudomonadota bacterium]|nr:sugar ABC transporter permease [Pseudomonadota bacterium]